MKKRTILFLLLTLLTLTLLSCGRSGQTGQGADAQDAPPAQPLTIVEDGATVYTIVRSDFATREGTASASLLYSYFQNRGVDIKLTTDWKDNAVTDYEILIGSTTRDGEIGFDPHDYGEDGWLVKASGTKLYILGGSDAATAEAANHFLRTFLGYTGDRETGEPLASLTIPGDYEYGVKTVYPVDSVTLCGRDLRGMVICAPRDLKTEAQTLQTMVYDASGIWMDIVSEAADNAVTLTRDGGMTFTMTASDSGIRMSCGAYGGIDAGLRVLERDYFTDLKGNIDMKDDLVLHFENAVTYEQFGAVGDGVTDDLDAVRAAHAFANSNGLPVKADGNAVYYLGRKSTETVKIATDTDWGTARFIIDDQTANVITTPLFTVVSLKSSFVPDIAKLKTGQEKLEITLPSDCVISVYNSGKIAFVRYGADANDGTSLSDVFYAHADGTVDPATPIVWDFDNVTSVTAYPVDETPLTVSGGVFTTVVYGTPTEYKYYHRGIRVMRSNTVVRGVTHTLENESSTAGSAYAGFLDVQLCANVRFEDCLLTAHRTFTSLKNGEKFTMGTYDIGATRALNVTYYNVTMTNDIMDSAIWGIMGTNYCKNLTYDSCVLNRFDSHTGCCNIVVKNTTLGYGGLNATGYGTLLVENVVTYGSSVVNLRSDFGSTWRGDVIIRGVEFTPRSAGSPIIAASNPETHDFGYTCYLPENVLIDGLTVHNQKSNDLYVFSAVNEKHTSDAFGGAYPMVPPKTVTVTHGLKTDRDVTLKLSPNAYIFRDTALIVE